MINLLQVTFDPAPLENLKYLTLYMYVLFPFKEKLWEKL